MRACGPPAHWPTSHLPRTPSRPRWRSTTHQVPILEAAHSLLLHRALEQQGAVEAVCGGMGLRGGCVDVGMAIPVMKQGCACGRSARARAPSKQAACWCWQEGREGCGCCACDRTLGATPCGPLWTPLPDSRADVKGVLHHRRIRGPAHIQGAGGDAAEAVTSYDEHALFEV